MQLHQPAILQELAVLEARLLVLSFAALPRLQVWLSHFETYFLRPSYEEQGLELPADIFARTCFLADPALEVYHAYGLGRNRPEEVYSRQILRQYARWRAQGKPVQPPAEDPLQRGGDFVVNRQNQLTLAHTGHGQAERPTIAAILAALRTIT